MIIYPFLDYADSCIWSTFALDSKLPKFSEEELEDNIAYLLTKYLATGVF